MAMTAATPIACIGAGYWGKNLVRNFHALRAFSQVCETSPERRAELAAAYPDANLTGLIDEVLADPRVTGVANATAETHGELVRRALLAGKDVFVEKPLCLSAAEGQELINLASQRGRVLKDKLLIYPLSSILTPSTGRTTSRLQTRRMPIPFPSIWLNRSEPNAFMFSNAFGPAIARGQMVKKGFGS